MSACIWYVSKYLSPSTEAAAGSRGYEIMREIAALGHQCVVITSDSNHLTQTPDFAGRELMETRDGLKLWWFKTIKSSRSKSVARALSWLHFEWRLLRFSPPRESRPDFIIASSLSIFTLISGLILRRRYGAQLVVEIRDIWPLTLVAEGGYSPRNPVIVLLSWIERTAYARADLIIGTMPNLKEHVQKVGKTSKRVDCIPMGFAPRVEARSVKHHPPVIDLPAARLTVAYAGTVGITNALETYFEAANKMSDDTSIQFSVIGDGGLLKDYRARFGHLPNLTFLPKVPKENVLPILRQCDLLYFSTFGSEVWRYGQSLNKLVDYMQAGRPILGSFSGYPSMIDEAQCGSFVAAENVDQLCNELRRFAEMTSKERDLIGARGRTWLLENRSFARLAEQYLTSLAHLPSSALGQSEPN